MRERSEEGAGDFKFLCCLKEKKSDFFKVLDWPVALLTFFLIFSAKNVHNNMENEGRKRQQRAKVKERHLCVRV